MRAKEILANEFKSGSWVHAYLIVSNDSAKRTELINYIISELKCLSSDISKLESANLSGKKGEIKVEEMRNFFHQINLSPIGKIRVAIINDCEKLNASSGNILLKSLEEPNGNIVFVLSSKTDKVLPTIRSRCQIIKIPGYPKPSANSDSYLEILDKDFFELSNELETIIKDERSAEFLDDLEIHFRERLIKEKTIQTVAAIKKINQARKDISSNANLRLTLESLILSLK